MVMDMSETTEVPTGTTHTTVKQYRDEIRANLSEAFKITRKYDANVGDVTAEIRRTIKGVQGFSKAQQVGALQDSLGQYTAAQEAVNAIDPAAVAAKVEADKQEALDALAQAVLATKAAIEFAEARDFEEYMKAKNAAKYSYSPSSEEYDEDEDDDDY